MRFCPFCAQENPDDVRECVHCGKRLPALRAAKTTPVPPKPAAPSRPVAPRPAPRAPSAAINDPTLKPPEAFAPTAAPGTFPPFKQPPHAPPNGPAKSTPHDATLKPLHDAEETRETPSPRVSAPTGTLLGLPVQEIPGALHPASQGDSERRTTRPLGLPTLAKEARRGLAFDEDAATEVHSASPDTIVDDGPTSRTPKMDDELENAKTTSRPAPRSRPLDSPRPNPLDAHRAGPADAHRPGPLDPQRTRPSPLPPARSSPPPARPSPLPSMPRHQPLPSSLIPTKPVALPEPLPPPPSKVGNDEGAFPKLDLGPTPAIPTLALPPMPEHPKSGSIVDAVKYLTPLAKAMWARKKAQDAIRTLLHGDQRLLDSVLRDLGRVAREEDVNAPAIADEMRRVKEQEDRRGAAEKQAADAESGQKQEDERWRIDEGQRQAELARREAEVKLDDDLLRKQAEMRRAHDAERAKIDGQIRLAEKRATVADAKAAKADATPPEKGGGPNTAANARAEAAEARKEATALIPTRDAAKGEVEKLDGPITELTKKLTDERATLVQKKKELAEAKAIHEKALADFQAAREKAGAERDAAERELTQRFVTAGTILNLNRVEHPKLAPLFARVDELKNGVNAREAAIVRLESERRLYDRGAVQKGLLTVGIAAGTLVLMAILLIVLIAR